VSALFGSAPAALLLDAALRGTLLLLLALGATRLMRRASAAARHLVWSAALGGVLLLPVLGLVVPRWNVLPLPALRPATMEATAPAAAPIVETRAAQESRIDLAVAEAPVPAALSAPAPREAQRTPLPDAGTLLLLAWVVVGGVLALRLAYGAVRVWWMERSAVEITDDGWVRTVDMLARRLRVGRIVTLLRSPGATVPMTWGVIRPVVLLPGEADAWDDERRTAVLAHELAHVRRWDALTQWVAHLAVVLFWFHPLVWMAARKLREEREHACDDAVLAMGTLPTRYADHLLQIVRALGTAEGPTAALAMARRSQFEGRLLAILDRATPRGGVTRAAALVTLALTAALVVPLAALGAADPVPAPQASMREEAESPAPESRPLEESSPAEEPRTVSSTPVTRSPAHPFTPVTESPQSPSHPVTPAVAVAWSLENDAARARYLAWLVETRPDSGVYVEIARAATRMSSPTAQRQVLEAVVSCPDVRRSGMVAVVEAVASVRSSTDQRVVLERVASRGWLRDPAVRRAFFRTLDSVPGSTDRRVLLERVLERGHTDPETLGSVIRAAGRLSGSSDARVVLTRTAATGRVTGSLRDPYVRTASALGDESDRATALAALLEPSRLAKTRTVAGGTDADGWTTEMVLSDGVLEYDDERGGQKWQITLTGQHFAVQSNGSATRVSVRPGGRAVLREKGPVTREVEIRVDASGRETRSWSVNGSRRAHDAEAEAWTSHFLGRLGWHLDRRSRGSARQPRAAESRRPAEWDSDQESIHDHHGKPASRLRLSASRVQVLGGEVVGMLPGGRLEVEQVLYPDFPDPDPLKPRPGETTTRTLQAKRRSDGTVQWTYRVNGGERPFEGEGRAWFDRILRKHTTLKKSS